MKIEQIYTGCIAQAAYYIECNGEAAIVDPLREVTPYIEKANENNATIKYIFETHFHADFVSGHLDLQKKTGAEIVFGPNAKPSYDSIIAEDNQIFKLGKSKIKVIHTPGHTMESTCFLLIDENDKEVGILTGDTLFIGDVGRPDLAQKISADLSQDKLARHLYQSLRNKIMPLADDIIVYPSHGAGSACGKNMSKETTDTLGNQKKVNYALQPMTEDEFVKAITEGLAAAPGYFPENVMMNILGYESLDTIIARGKNALNAANFEILANETQALILDTRSPAEFAKGFIPNSINIGLDGSFAPWVGEMIVDIKQEILLVCDPNREEEAITRLSRVGYDNTIGFLENGFETWKNSGKEIDVVNRISANEIEQNEKYKNAMIFDVRKKSEFESEHLEQAKNISLNEINKHLSSFPKDEFFIIHCAGGYRSMIAASILKQRGFENFVDVVEGFGGLSKTNLPKTNFVCPSTLL